MAGKAVVFGSQSMAVAVDLLTKNQMADLIIHLAKRSVGDNVDESVLMGQIAGWMNPVWIARKDRPVDIMSSYQRMRDYEDKKSAAGVK